MAGLLLLEWRVGFNWLTGLKGRAETDSLMRILIDGYNLLHATDLFGQGELAGTLQGSREALLGYLASRLTARERRATTIVFDAAGAPPGLPDEATFEGIRVLFARGYADADAMIEAIVEQARAPKALTVVSGDRRVQRAARQRGAAWVESVDWRRELQSRTPQQHQDPSSKAPPSGEVGGVEYWVNEFTSGEPAPSEGDEPNTNSPHGNPKPAEAEQPVDLDQNPFPAGYADDLAEELEQPDPEPPGRD